MRVPLKIVVVLIGIAVGGARFSAQDRLAKMPGVDQYRKMQQLLSPATGGAYVSGAITAAWAEDGKSFTYNFGGSRYRFDVTTMTAMSEGPATTGPGGRGGRAGGPPAGGGRGGRGGATGLGGCPPAQVDRGRQASCVGSPDGAMRAFYKDRNIWIANADGTGEKALTTDGSEEKRIKYGTASWVYGEELDQTSAIWWSPDSTKVAFYRFDESKVKDFYLQMSQTDIQSALDVEAYPKAGAPNPVADIFIYDVKTGKPTKVDVRDGRPFTDIPETGVFTNDNVGHYVYKVTWSPDGSELLMNRTNRRQNKLEFAGCTPTSGECRVILSESWPTGWVVNSPPMQYLKDNRRFIWTSERNGWRNLYLYDMAGKLITPLTQHTTFEVVGVTKVDEAAGVVYYTARSGDNWMKVQLHRVGLDGKGDVRLTDPKFTHSVSLSPDNKFIVDTIQTHKDPPASRLLDGSGKVLKDIVASDMTKFTQNGLKKSEQFTYLAADGKTTLYGMISFPSNFDPSKKYPSLASVYGGPGSAVTSENFAPPSATAEYGFLMLQLSSRSVPGMGKRALDAAYLNLGVTEMDDMALGVKALWSRPYFDKDRVGIYGTSYGGYSSALSILKHPDVWAAASASSS
ncbi:MAG TPA: DPP IV N-terminal domain-containing protein, partial [Vicinamibacterales bacterium]|nr:DPP IV N-terminal domain-containing protein [Vicinamibacterales bacterium]